jgi:hypothetical protein
MTQIEGFVQKMQPIAFDAEPMNQGYQKYRLSRNQELADIFDYTPQHSVEAEQVKFYS